MFYYGALVLTVVSNVFYHIIQKSTPSNTNPFLSLTITYLVAAAISVMAFLASPRSLSFWDSMRTLSWPSFALGIAIVGLETGFLLAYRAGWNVSVAGIVSNVAVGLILIPVGLLLFDEKISWPHLVGILLCVGGLILINQR